MKKIIYIFALLASSASAQTLTNNGTVLYISPGTTLSVSGSVSNTLGTLNNSGTLSTTGNFTNADVYTGNGKIELTGSSQQSIDMGTSPLYNLDVNKGGSIVVLNNDMTITNYIDLTGNGNYIQLGNYNLNMQNGSVFTGAGTQSFVVTDGTGKLLQNVSGGSVVFPVGSALASYTPATLANTGTSDVFGIRVLDNVYSSYNNNGVPSGSPLSPAQEVNKTWIVDEATTGGSTLALTFTWNTANEGGSFYRSNCAIALFSGGSWQANTNGAAASGSNPYSISRSGLTNSFANTPFGIGGNPNSPLPVTWLGFTATKKGNDAQLNWSTATEYNSSHFVVQRSLNGKDFEDIGNVKAAGNSKSISNYNILDPNIIAFADKGITTLYYRLAQYDLDGQINYSIVRSIYINNEKSITQVSLYPNPSSGMSYLFIASESSELASIQITDITGKLIYKDNLNLNAQGKLVELGGENLAKGIYVIQIEQGGQRQVLKWVRE
ncbi:MAG: T9SS type A sorting domain-containing protein [Bacteroidota bacterium]|nr:T9SS type A sorting domain-containing protein [Bacteroidota bacterium]